eukprot:CAMPEP_0180489912 /NCGR_PEP_ID=MMETSP1036_2-20121128/38842_1 /TAXON_ID=632150 /ORGANISM="Azadinium spinosum, Strain 3D9" /LENGTH=143 /DNA_ID=CAMNT_0022498085 /DNA_START=274 /DNA_END=705 /DNA_ORIENTATION=-
MATGAAGSHRTLTGPGPHFFQALKARTFSRSSRITHSSSTVRPVSQDSTKQVVQGGPKVVAWFPAIFPRASSCRVALKTRLLALVRRDPRPASVACASAGKVPDACRSIAIGVAHSMENATDEKAHLARAQAATVQSKRRGDH